MSPHNLDHFYHVFSDAEKVVKASANVMTTLKMTRKSDSDVTVKGDHGKIVITLKDRFIVQVKVEQQGSPTQIATRTTAAHSVRKLHQCSPWVTLGTTLSCCPIQELRKDFPTAAISAHEADYQPSRQDDLKLIEELLHKFNNNTFPKNDEEVVEDKDERIRVLQAELVAQEDLVALHLKKKKKRGKQIQDLQQQLQEQEEKAKESEERCAMLKDESVLLKEKAHKVRRMADRWRNRLRRLQKERGIKIEPEEEWMAADGDHMSGSDKEPSIIELD